MSSVEEFAQEIIKHSQFRDDAILKALQTIDRAKFVSGNLLDHAYADHPLPIGFGQTISQPSTVVFMLERLNIQPGLKILEVGSGCGWVSALMAYIVGDKGKVIGIDIIPELVEQARQNVKDFNLKNLEFMSGDGSKGYAQAALYDRIIVSAGAKEMPKKLLEQLKDNGRAVIPVGDSFQDIVVLDRKGNKFNQTRCPGFMFVPLISKD